MEKYMNDQKQFSLSISPAQYQHAIALYDALLTQDLNKIYDLINLQVKAELQQKTESLQAAFTVLEGKNQTEAELIAIEKTTDASWGQIYKVSFRFDYVENDILYTVVFADGNKPDIIGFWINQTQN